MIDYTQKTGGPVSSHQYFDEVILTCRTVHPNRDVTRGRFAVEADPTNDAFKIFVLTDIEATDDADVFYVLCRRSINDVEVYLRLRKAPNVTVWGYEATAITVQAPP